MKLTIFNRLKICYEVLTIKKGSNENDLPTFTQLEKSLTDYAKKDIEGALQLITGMFIDINIAYAEIRADGDGEKRIDITDGRRKVTIHSAHL